MKNKLKSRKFWISVATFLSSIATTISGFSMENQYITVAGIICATISTSIYTIMEAFADITSIENKGE